MNRLKTNEFITNPYKVDAPVNSSGNRFSYLAPEKISFLERSLAPAYILGNAARMGHAFVTRDEEALVDTAGKIARAIDVALIWVTATIQVGSLAEVVSRKLFPAYTHFSNLSMIVRICALPLSIIFGVLAVIEAIYEGTNFIRCFKLMHRLSGSDLAKEEDIVQNLKVVQKRFFSIKDKESSKITAFIERRFGNCSRNEKAEKYDEMANQLLSVKYANLSRRVSAKFAGEVSDNLKTVLKGLGSDKQSERLHALEKGRALLQTISTQAKKKLLVHFVALLAIAVTIISLLAVFTGVGTIPALAALTGLAILLGITHYMLEEGLLSQEGWNFSFEECIPGWVKTILCINSSEASGKDPLETQAAH